jgi:hypothetical protein
MTVMENMGNQLQTEFGKAKGTKVPVALLRGEQVLTGIVFTAQRDYLQLDEEPGGSNRRFTVPYTAIAFICGA